MWQKIAVTCLLLVAASLVGAFVARLTMSPYPLMLEARQFFQVADTLLLFVIAVGVLRLSREHDQKP